MLTHRLGLAPSISKETLELEIVVQYSKTITKEQSLVIDTLTFVEDSFVFRGRLYTKNDWEAIVGKGKMVVKVNKTGGQYQPEIFLEFSIEKAPINVG